MKNLLPLLFVALVLLMAQYDKGIIFEKPEKRITVSQAIADLGECYGTPTYRALPSGSFNKLSAYLRTHDQKWVYDDDDPAAEEIDYRYKDSSGNLHCLTLTTKPDSSNIITASVNFADYFTHPDDSKPMFFYTINESDVVMFNAPESKGQEDKTMHVWENFLAKL